MATGRLRGKQQAPVIQLRRQFDGTINPADLERLADLVQDLASKLTGGLTFGSGASFTQAGNSNSAFVDYTFDAANTLYTIPHGLRRVPAGFMQVMQDAACIVYDPNFGAAWGESVVRLACDTAGAKVKLLLLG